MTPTRIRTKSRIDLLPDCMCNLGCVLEDLALIAAKACLKFVQARRCLCPTSGQLLRCSQCTWGAAAPPAGTHNYAACVDTFIIAACLHELIAGVKS